MPGYVLQGDSSGGTLLGVPVALAHGIRDVWCVSWAVIVMMGPVAAFSVHLKPRGMWSNEDLRDRLAELSRAIAVLDARHQPRVWVGGCDANAVALAGVPGVTGQRVYARRRDSAGIRDAARSRIWMDWLSAEGFLLSNTQDTGASPGHVDADGDPARAARGAWTWRPRIAKRPGELRAARRRRKRDAKLSASQIDFVLVRGPVVGEARTHRVKPWTSDHRPNLFVGDWLQKARGPLPRAESVRRNLRGWTPDGQSGADEYRHRCADLLEVTSIEGVFAGIRRHAEAAPHTTASERRLHWYRATEEEAQARRRWRAEMEPGPRAELKRAYYKLRRARRRRATVEEASRVGAPRSITAMTGAEGRVTADRAEWTQLQSAYVTQLFQSRRHQGQETTEARARGILTAARARAPAASTAAPGLPAWIGALGRLSNATSYGTDGVTASMLRALPWAVKRHVAALLDGLTGDELPRSWCEVELVAIGKDKVQAPAARQLRYLGLGTLSQKLFANGVVPGLPPAPPWHVGFVPGHSPHDVVGILRSGIYDAVVWQDPGLALVILSCDVERAFDSIEHDVLAASLLGQGVPPAAAELLMLPLLGGRARIRGGADACPTHRGTRTGGVESPYNLNAVLAQATGAVARRWMQEGRGWGGARCSSLWWWADNAFVLAHTVEEAFEMFGALTAALAGVGMRWKAASLELCTAGDTRRAEAGTQVGERTTRVGEEDYKFAERRQLRVLGPVLPASARQREEVDLALNAANGRWHARRRYWRSRFLGQHAKLRRFFADVCGALVEQAGGWHLTANLMTAIGEWERGRLRLLIGMRARGEEESSEDYWRAFERRLNETCAQAGVRRLGERIVRAYARRGARMSTAAEGSAQAVALATAMRKRQVAWRQHAPTMLALDPRNAQLWRHKRKGRQPAEWEDAMVRALGEDWVVEARTEPEPDFVTRVTPLLLAVLRMGGARRREARRRTEAQQHAQRPAELAVAPPDARALPLLRLTIQSSVDARWLAESFCGECRPPRSGPLAVLWRRALHAADALWQRGFRWGMRGPVQWIPRGLNEAADSLVHVAAQGPVLYQADRAAIAALARRTGGTVRLRLFSDGGMAPGVPARWSAVVFFDDGHGLRLAAAAAGWATTCTVPAAELEGAARAWDLAAWVSAELVGDKGTPLGEGWEGEPLADDACGRIETLGGLAWAPRPQFAYQGGGSPPLS